MFILSSISSDLEFWSVNGTSINENSELKVFKNFLMKYLVSDLLGTNVCKTVESC